MVYPGKRESPVIVPGVLSMMGVEIRAKPFQKMCKLQHLQQT